MNQLVNYDDHSEIQHDDIEILIVDTAGLLPSLKCAPEKNASSQKQPLASEFSPLRILLM
jgi:hypothetical protein